MEVVFGKANLKCEFESLFGCSTSRWWGLGFLAALVEGRGTSNLPPACLPKPFASSVAFLGWLGHAAALKARGEMVVNDWNDFVLNLG